MLLKWVVKEKWPVKRAAVHLKYVCTFFFCISVRTRTFNKLLVKCNKYLIKKRTRPMKRYICGGNCESGASQFLSYFGIVLCLFIVQFSELNFATKATFYSYFYLYLANILFKIFNIIVSTVIFTILGFNGKL